MMKRHPWMPWLALFSFALLSILIPPHAEAITLPAGFTESSVAAGLLEPTAMAFAPDGRLFVCEQAGRLRVIKDGVLLAKPFVTVGARGIGEQGLLGVAFDPDFATTPYVYVYYTAARRLDGVADVNHRVSRFLAAGDVAAANSETVLLEILDNDTAEWHNGGAMKFGADGKLLIAVGDRSHPETAQSFGILTGKMLRMNKDGSIPTDNPFYGTAAGRNRLIWLYGLRNPYTFDVQPGTGRVFINDVGAAAWEEVNEGVAGANYGWPASEGPTTNTAHRAPLYAYNHGDGCAIIGAAFYNPQTVSFPSEYMGRYFFSDHCGHFLRTLDPANGNAVATFAAEIETLPVDLEVGLDGALYYLTREDGSVRRIAYADTALAPSITSQPTDQIVTSGEPATFAVTASGTSPLRYQWKRNGANVAGATASSYTIGATAAADNGALFQCVVTNAKGSVESREATLTATANTAPTATLVTPEASTTYGGGQRIDFSGTATDTEDGTLPASAFTWRIDFHHDAHTHPALPSTSGSTSGSYVIPTTGETSTNVWFRVHLTVVDSGGLSRHVFRDVRPRVTTLTLATDPSGLAISLDGQAPRAAPFSFDAVEGMQRSVTVATPQMAMGKTWQLASWSDGGAGSHGITIPAAGATLTAAFTEVPTAPITRYEQNQAPVLFRGSWSTRKNALDSAGSAALSKTTGSDVRFSFTGTRVTWIGARGPECGLADVYVDNVLKARVDLYTSTRRAQRALFSATGLTPGPHTIRVYVRGARRAASGGTWVWVDAFVGGN